MSIVLFSIGNETFQSLDVTKFNYSVEILDGPGTGRTQSEGWEMFRQPQGTIKNIEIEIAMPLSTNPEFIRLLEILDGFGETDFKTVTFLTPSGTITQDMYAGSYNMGASVIRYRNGTTISIWDVLRIKFIAKKAVNT